MQTVVFIGSNKSGSCQDSIEAAERLGYYTVLLTNRNTFLEKRSDFPHVHEMILTDLRDMDDIRDKLEFMKLQGKRVEAIASSIDPYVYTAAMLGREFGLPHQTDSAIAQMLDKTVMRNVLRETGLTPYYTTDSNLSPDLLTHLPLVVKCPRSNGSKDVLLANTRTELEDRIEYLKKRYPEEAVLFEEYVGGQQYLVEVLVHQGEPRIVAIVEQTITRERRFIVTAYRIRPAVAPAFSVMVEAMVNTVVQKTEMVTGALHIEFKVSHGEFKIIEVNPRISGSSMNRMIRCAFGINLVEETLKSQLGVEPDTERKHERHVFTQYLTVHEKGVLDKVTGKNRARCVPGIAEVYVKPRIGAILIPAVSMGHRYAYVIGVGKEEADAENAAKTAASMIKFHTHPR